MRESLVLPHDAHCAGLTKGGRARQRAPCWEPEGLDSSASPSSLNLAPFNTAMTSRK